VITTADVEISLSGNQYYLLVAFNSAKTVKNDDKNTFSFNGKRDEFNSRCELLKIKY
jgi:hypothetical protein